MTKAWDRSRCKHVWSEGGWSSTMTTGHRKVILCTNCLHMKIRYEWYEPRKGGWVVKNSGVELPDPRVNDGWSGRFAFTRLATRARGRMRYLADMVSAIRAEEKKVK